MNTYRIYVLDASTALEPIVTVAYGRSEKYAGIWTGARAALDADKASKAVKLFADPACSIPSAVKPGDRVTVGRIDDIRPRNVKLDKAALEALVNDPDTSPADKLAAIQALLG